MSNQEVMGQIATKLSNLRTAIMEGQINDKEIISEKLEAIRDFAEKNDVAFIIDDEDYINLLSDSDIGEEEEESYEESYEPSYDEENEEDEESSY